MKKIFLLLAVLCLSLYLNGCGGCRKRLEEMQYESITGTKGSLVLVSGGIEYKKYSKVKITYSSSDSQAIKFEILESEIKDEKGKEMFWQGDALFEKN